jgi:hypothetical protein
VAGLLLTIHEEQLVLVTTQLLKMRQMAPNNHTVVRKINENSPNAGAEEKLLLQLSLSLQKQENRRGR